MQPDASMINCRMNGVVTVCAMSLWVGTAIAIIDFFFQLLEAIELSLVPTLDVNSQFAHCLWVLSFGGFGGG